jgi:FKBP-type peptidyl-prolyl cis-trans isomerase 2
MQTNDFIYVTYTGKIKENGQEFDKTGDKPAPLIVKSGFLLKGLEEAILGMNVNEKKTVEVTPDKAFGDRNPKMIRLIPISEFRKHNTQPKPGMVFNADNMRGRVLTVSGGRVEVDFNHPLAGKTLIYDVEILEKAEKTEDKIMMIFQMYNIDEKDKIKVMPISDKEIEITIPPLINSLYKKKIASDIMEILKFEKVKFSEVFEKPKESV